MTTEQELRMFGCTTQELRDETDKWIGCGDRPPMLAMSLLSDAQDILAGMYAGATVVYVEKSRQLINRAKWIISNYW